MITTWCTFDRGWFADRGTGSNSCEIGPPWASDDRAVVTFHADEVMSSRRRGSRSKCFSHALSVCISDVGAKITCFGLTTCERANQSSLASDIQYFCIAQFNSCALQPSPRPCVTLRSSALTCPDSTSGLIPPYVLEGTMVPNRPAGMLARSCAPGQHSIWLSMGGMAIFVVRRVPEFMSAFRGLGNVESWINIHARFGLLPSPVIARYQWRSALAWDCCHDLRELARHLSRINVRGFALFVVIGV